MPWPACDSPCPLRARWSFHGAHGGKGEGREVSVPSPGPRTGWLGSEITGASRKIISICLGLGKVGPQAPPPSGNSPCPHQGAQAHRLSTSYPRLPGPSSNSCGDHIHPAREGGPGQAGGRLGPGRAVGGVLGRSRRSSPRSGRSRPALGGARAGSSPGSVWK